MTLAPEITATPAQPVGRSRDLRMIAGFAIAASILSGVIPILMLQEIPDEGRSPAWQMTLLIMVWAGLRLSYRIVLGEPKLFDFVFWLFTYIFMGLAPTVQIRSGEVAQTTPGVNPDLDMPAAVAVVVGLLAYEAGRWIRRDRTRDRPQPDDEGLSDAIAPRRVLILALVGVVSAAYYVSAIGVATLFMSRYSSFEIRSMAIPDLALRSVISSAASYPLLISAVAFIRLRKATPPGPRRDAFLIGALVTVPVLLLLANPISSARYDFGTVGLALVIAAGAAATVRRARWTMVGLIAAFLFVFPLADAFRTDNVNLERQGFFGEYLGNPDYDAFWQIANTLAYLVDQGINWGSQALGVLFFWVPRAIWPAKPVDTGVLLAEYRGYSFDNLSAPMWSELLINGGWLFLVLGFLAIGFLLQRLDARVSKSLLSDGQFWAVAGAVFPFFMVILLRGSLLQATGALVVAVASLWFIKQPKRRGDVEEPPQSREYDSSSDSPTAAMLSESREYASPRSPMALARDASSSSEAIASTSDERPASHTRPQPDA